MKTTTTFTNHNNNLFLKIDTTVGYEEKISIYIEVYKKTWQQDEDLYEVLYNGTNLSEAIDIFNKNL